MGDKHNEGEISGRAPANSVNAKRLDGLRLETQRGSAAHSQSEAADDYWPRSGLRSKCRERAEVRPPEIKVGLGVGTFSR